ncbi:MAG: alpha/beta fold hydrolase [Chitinophagaceae bacterium]|nr:alpha/beta fold hydrolase [Chitinophagaceae bacterium]
MNFVSTKRIFFETIFLFISFTIMTTNSFSQSTKPTIVLIHGAWFGSFAWNKVVPLVESKGYNVITMDLPGYGNAPQSLANITLNDYVNAVVDLVQPVKGKVILVGHSMGGAVITQAAEVIGVDKVEKLIFLDAFLLRNGESILDQVGKIHRAMKEAGNMEEKKIVADFLVFSEDRNLCTIAAGKTSEVFAHDCPPEDQAILNSTTRWQPVSALATPMNVSDKIYGSIPKYYIQCAGARDLDRTSILNNMPCQKVYTLPSSHSPFFSMPDKLVAIVDEIATN